jgi:hypothetical protein
MFTLDGVTVALGTMHQKETVIAPAFARMGVSIVVPADFDTDQFGTFSGEVSRTGTMKDAARAKARAAIAATGLRHGIASEGSYGPHPQIPFLAFGLELMLWRDEHTGHEVVATAFDAAPRFSSVEARRMNDAQPFLSRIGFPATAVVVSAVGSSNRFVRKGLRDHTQLEAAISEAVSQSNHGLALLQTDMRAHMNPRRMATIASLAEKFVDQLTHSCPNCEAPGYGVVRIEAGLPCRWCGGPTEVTAFEIRGCTACGLQARQRRNEGVLTADPGFCPNCNP